MNHPVNDPGNRFVEFYCSQCDDAWGPTDEKMDRCPRCNTELLDHVPEDFWVQHPECLEIKRLLAEQDEAGSRDNEVLEQLIAVIVDEYRRAATKFAPMNSAHEGYAVLLEEVDELWDAVKRNDLANIREEAVQVAAMGIRFLMDVVYKTGGASEK